MPNYFYIYKPYGMMSQFSPSGDKPVLGRLYNFPSDVYPVGRLDADSEGLLILTNDKKLNALLLSPKNKHERTYWVQVDGAITDEALKKLEQPMKIKVGDKVHITAPAKAQLLDEAPLLPERNPPVRFRKSVPTSWISLTLTEGKNRQVRKMTAKVGFPTLRLVRQSIEYLEIKRMASGEVKQIDAKSLYELLNISERAHN